MRKISQIKIKNFKAFQEEQEFNLGGKNVLVYGNNGSGKSSLFWALYTLTQSSIKQDVEIQKYFRNFVESDTETHQSLRNVFTNDNDDSFIEMTAVDENDKRNVYTISYDTINTNKDSDTTIQELNQASDFINYKLLHNFYAVSHKQEVNLWQVFERDMFPYLLDNANRIMLDKIRERTADVERYDSGQPVRGKRAEVVKQELDEINAEIESLLSQIQNNANDFIKKHFFDNNEVIRLSLEFAKRFDFEKIQKKLWEPGKESERYSNLQIRLVIEVYEESGGNWKQIHRVQSFLNEALLTRIAISIRIGALRTRVQTTEFKILVLDDMLISLDMSNRMPIIKMILNIDQDPDLHYFDEFQKIILTHDKGFYELVKRYTSPQQWEYFTLYAKEDDNTPPAVKIDRTHIEKAQKYLADGEYDACGQELRKEMEALLGKYLRGLNSAAELGEFEPLSSQLNRVFNQITEANRKDFERLFVNKKIPVDHIQKLQTDYANDDALDENDKGRLDGLKRELIAYLIKQYELKDSKAKLEENIQDTLKRVMNPAAHHSLIPLYESELKQAILEVQKLKELLDQE